MAFGHGKNTVVLMSEYNMSDYLNSMDSSYSGDSLETTVFNSSGNKTYIPGKKDATISGEGLFDGVATPIKNLGDALGSSTQQNWSVYPYGSSLASYGYGVATRETKYDISTPIDDVVSISVEGQSNIGRERLRSYKALTSVTTSNTNNLAGVLDNGWASTRGIVSYFHRTDTGTRSLVATVKHSSGGAYTVLSTFSALTGKATLRTASTTPSIKRYLVVLWDLGATTKAVTFQAGVCRN